MDSANQPALLGLSLDELQAQCLEWGMPKFAARQLCDWLYKKRADSFEAMTNLSLRHRALLAEVATVGRTAPVASQRSKDGTVKYLFATRHGYIESVYIPDADRATLCVSSQVGCKMGCRFCVTGKQGFHGSLSAAEILNQIFSIPEAEKLTNVVFMGMGEPMDNLDAVLAACRVLTAEWGLGWSPKRITVSSVGLTPQVLRFVEQSQCHLAVSLHNPIAAERADLMPVERAYPAADLLDALRRYNWSGQRRLSFEYTMFGGLNDDIAHAAALVSTLRGLDCRVNLIRFHTSEGMPFRTSSATTIEAFRDYLNRHGLKCTLRASRGEDIDAACGLLAGKQQ